MASLLREQYKREKSSFSTTGNGCVYCATYNHKTNVEVFIIQKVVCFSQVVVLLCSDMDLRNNSNLLGENVILTFLLDKRDLETVKFRL